jgi:hypothetical protein
MMIAQNKGLRLCDHARAWRFLGGLSYSSIVNALAVLPAPIENLAC